MTSRPTADEVCAKLTPFQRLTVDHVMERFHGDQPSRRLLVADETGLGKSIVARGVIARTIDQLEADGSTDRITVVYVCSNQDLATQNLNRLNVTGARAQAVSTRLTLLAQDSVRLQQPDSDGRTPVNLVSFTPGTSFTKGWSGGKAGERALLHVILDTILTEKGLATAKRERASRRMLQGNVGSLDTFTDHYVAHPASLRKENRLDTTIIKAFSALIQERDGEQPSLLDRTLELLDDLPDGEFTPTHRHEIWMLTGDLRTSLARASVDAITPDLVILDEFQRFRDLLDPCTDAGDLAHALFDHGEARVLLLSATPYKPFTFAEEGEDHETDFLTVIDFLAKGGTGVSVDAIRAGFAAIRDAARRGVAPTVERDRLSAQLRRVMTRWERPSLDHGSMHEEKIAPAVTITTDDLSAFGSLATVAREVARPRDHGLIRPEYWKSAPYFLNFCGGYKLGRRLTHDDDGAPSTAWTQSVREAVAAARPLGSHQVESFERVDAGNARMRVLFDQTVEQGWWKLLWVPPTLPYIRPRRAYAEPWVASMTKRLVFSSWTATPAAVASLVSYEAERRMAHGSTYEAYTPEGRRKVARGLGYSVSDGRPSNMTTLLMMWPLTRLSRLGDVREMVRDNGGSPIIADDAVQALAAQLETLYGGADAELPEAERVAQDSLWRTAFNDPGNWLDLEIDGTPDAIPEKIRPIVAEMARTRADAPEDEGAADDDTTEALPDGGRRTGLERHVLRALGSRARGRVVPDLRDRETLARIALFAPGCVSLRVVRRLVAAAESATAVSEEGMHVAAATLANAVRSVFQKPEAVALLSKPPYAEHSTWLAALHYCADGNLEAVLDEWLFHLWSDRGGKEFTDESLLEHVRQASKAVALRAASYSALDPAGPQKTLSFSGGLAERYGGRDEKAEDARQPEVRAAFNSPFRPFVLASTSVGQEGVDFHWWCHAVFHWNTPPNPVDFEQREGRVDRYHGHAVRKNIAAAHSAAILAADDTHPWSAAYTVAQDQADEFGFAPDWVYPGAARIERHVAPMAFSTDLAVYRRVRQDVAFYRVALGQPRQEDMVEMLRHSDLSPDELRLDLRPIRAPEQRH